MDTNPFDQFDASNGNPFDQFDAAPAPTDRYAGMSFKDRAVNDLKMMGTAAKRAALLGVKGFNDTVAGTAAMPADAAIGAYNLATGGNVQTMGDWWKQRSDADIQQPQNIPEMAIYSGTGAATALGAPLPGNGLGTPTVTSAQRSYGLGRASGYKVAPSEVQGAPPTLKLAEKIAGPKQVAAAASAENSAKLSENIASQLGMPKGTEINPDTIDAVISHAGDTGYGAIAARGKWYADKIEAVKSLRNLASKYYKQSAANYSVDAESKADMLRSEADAMDKQIESALAASKSLNKGGDFQTYIDARKTIAQAYDTMKALVKSRGTLDETTFANLYDKGKPLSGEMLSAGRSAEAFPKSFGTAEPQGLGRLNTLDNWLLGSGAGIYELTKNPKLAASVVAGGLARTGVRHALLSDPVQNYMLLTPQARQQALAEALLRGSAGGQGLGR